MEVSGWLLLRLLLIGLGSVSMAASCAVVLTAAAVVAGDSAEDRPVCGDDRLVCNTLKFRPDDGWACAGDVDGGGGEGTWIEGPEPSDTARPSSWIDSVAVMVSEAFWNGKKRRKKNSVRVRFLALRAQTGISHEKRDTGKNASRKRRAREKHTIALQWHSGYLQQTSTLHTQKNAILLLVCLLSPVLHSKILSLFCVWDFFSLFFFQFKSKSNSVTL